MRSYQLYIIEDEFAAHYFGRERMFYQLFFEFSKATDVEKTILNKQIQYITKRIPVKHVRKTLKKHLLKRTDFTITENCFYIEVNDYSYATMSIYDSYIEIEATGSYEAEAVYFEVLRKWEDFYLAVDLNNERFGWLKPLRERKFIMENIKQILYNDISLSTL